MPKKALNDICTETLSDNKAENVLSLDIKGISSFADNIIIATANSNRHAKSLSEKLVEEIKANKISIMGVEGKTESGWILVDCIKGISSFADNIIIATANSNRHAKSLSEKLVEEIKANKISIMGVEGKTESGWILVDCGEVVVNIMKNDIREFYDLEGLWGENTLIDSSK